MSDNPACSLCYGSGWIPGVALPDEPLEELPCPECKVKVYLFEGECMDCGGGPYFMEPVSPTGHRRRIEVARARMVPAVTLARWKAAEAAREQMEQEIMAYINGQP